MVVGPAAAPDPGADRVEAAHGAEENIAASLRHLGGYITRDFEQRLRDAGANASYIGGRDPRYFALGRPPLDTANNQISLAWTSSYNL